MVARWSKSGEARNKLMYTNSSFFHLLLELSSYPYPSLLSHRSPCHPPQLHSNPVHFASLVRSQPHYSQLLWPSVREWSGPPSDKHYIRLWWNEIEDGQPQDAIPSGPKSAREALALRARLGRLANSFLDIPQSWPTWIRCLILGMEGAGLGGPDGPLPPWKCICGGIPVSPCCSMGAGTFFFC